MTKMTRNKRNKTTLDKKWNSKKVNNIKEYMSSLDASSWSEKVRWVTRVTKEKIYWIIIYQNCKEGKWQKIKVVKCQKWHNG